MDKPKKIELRPDRFLPQADGVANFEMYIDGKVVETGWVTVAISDGVPYGAAWISR